MRRGIASIAVAGIVAAGAMWAPAVRYEQLSPEARELFPKGRPVVVTLQDGREFEGIVTEQSAERFMLQTRQPSGLWMARPMLKSAVRELRDLEMDTLWGERLLEIVLDEKGALPEAAYVAAIARFDEYLGACPAAPQAPAVRERKAAFERELAYLRAGREKVEGAWLTPVRAAVRWFEIHTAQIETLRRRPDAQRNERVAEAIEKASADRREVARRLPRLTKERVEELVAKRQFDEPVQELNAFLDFWIQQVMRAEGSVGQAFGQMDFSFVRELQELIMAAYRDSGMDKRGVAVQPPEGMVLVPGGLVLVGDPHASPGQPEFPSRVVHVSPFFIDRYEVNNAEYRAFVEYVQRTRDESLAHPDAPPLKKHDALGWAHPALAGDDQPVVGVDWFDAYAYAKWVGKRLPTEVEWEKAARLLDARPYPWGTETPTAVAANFGPGRRTLAAEMDRQNPPKPVETRGSGGCLRRAEPPLPPPPTELPAGTWPVRSALAPAARKAVERDELTWTRSSASALGCLHMAGNAAEWVADYYEREAYVTMTSRDPQGPERGAFRAYRGGSYLSERDEELRAYRRWGADVSTRTGSTRGNQPFIGFRGVRSVEEVGKDP